MPQRQVKERTYQIVLTGSLNPQIFQPAWFAAKGLVRPSEAEGAKVKVIHQSVADFQIDWAYIQVLVDRFSATTKDDGCDDLLKDLVVGVFKILGETPVAAVGINSTIHFQVEDTKVWNAIGHKLVPKDPLWSKILKEPGTRSLTIEGKHPDGSKGQVRVRVEPSNVYPTCIYSDVNYHYDVTDNSGKMGTGLAASRLLEEKWKESADSANKIFGTLMTDL